MHYTTSNGIAARRPYKSDEKPARVRRWMKTSIERRAVAAAQCGRSFVARRSDGQSTPRPQGCSCCHNSQIHGRGAQSWHSQLDCGGLCLAPCYSSIARQKPCKSPKMIGSAVSRFTVTKQSSANPKPRQEKAADYLPLYYPSVFSIYTGISCISKWRCILNCIYFGDGDASLDGLFVPIRPGLIAFIFIEAKRYLSVL